MAQHRPLSVLAAFMVLAGSCATSTAPASLPASEHSDGALLRAWGEDSSGATDAERLARARANALSALAEQVEVEVRTTSLLDSERITRRVDGERLSSSEVGLRRTTELHSSLVLTDARVVTSRCSAGTCRALLELDLATARTLALRRLRAMEADLWSALAGCEESIRMRAWRDALNRYAEAVRLLRRTEHEARDLVRLGGASWSSSEAQARLRRTRSALLDSFALCLTTEDSRAAELAHILATKLARRDVPLAVRPANDFTPRLDLRWTSQPPRTSGGLVLVRLQLRASLIEPPSAPIVVDLTGLGLAEAASRAERRALEDALDRLADALASNLLTASSEPVRPRVSYD
jgi:hypothetical protein